MVNLGKQQPAPIVAPVVLHLLQTMLLVIIMTGPDCDNVQRNIAVVICDIDIPQRLTRTWTVKLKSYKSLRMTSVSFE